MSNVEFTGSSEEILMDFKASGEHIVKKNFKLKVDKSPVISKFGKKCMLNATKMRKTFKTSDHPITAKTFIYQDLFISTKKRVTSDH